MLIIPAIDIKAGVCVRLKQGNFSEQTVYSDSPVETALYFQELGAQRLHLVDLDGAETGKSNNKAVIAEILSNVKIPIQLGGGIRSFEDIKSWLTAGIHSVILGTLALENPQVVKRALDEFGPERIIVAMDTRKGKIAVKGWRQQSEIEAVELAQNYKRLGLKRVLYTDIARDGMLTGPDINALKHVAITTGLNVTASGGIASKQDLRKLAALEPLGVDSVIVGRAFYERRILPEEVF